MKIKTSELLSIDKDLTEFFRKYPDKYLFDRNKKIITVFGSMKESELSELKKMFPSQVDQVALNGLMKRSYLLNKIFFFCRRTFSPHRIFRKVFSKVLNIDPWHGFILRDRQYAIELINFINNDNSLHKNKIVEIGCGLGDIIRNIKSDEKYCFDMDMRVLKGLKYLSLFRNVGNGKIFIKQFDFVNDKLTGKFDIIILMGFLHIIEPNVLVQKLKELYAVIGVGGCLFIDTVSDPGYLYCHNIDKIQSELGVQAICINTLPGGRKIYQIKK